VRAGSRFVAARHDAEVRSSSTDLGRVVPVKVSHFMLKKFFDVSPSCHATVQLVVQIFEICVCCGRAPMKSFRTLAWLRSSTFASPREGLALVVITQSASMTSMNAGTPAHARPACPSGNDQLGKVRRSILVGVQRPSRVVLAYGRSGRFASSDRERSLRRAGAHFTPVHRSDSS